MHNYNHLVHVSDFSYYQFITFRTHDSTDAFLVKQMKQEQSTAENQMKIDEYLDLSEKGCYLSGDVLNLLYHDLLKNNGNIFELYAFSIMPNHVHLLIKPNFKLGDVMKKIKGGSALLINQILHKKGKFWEADYYDRAIRSSRHFNTVYNYIKANPLKLVGAKQSSLRFYGCYE